MVFKCPKIDTCLYSDICLETSWIECKYKPSIHVKFVKVKTVFSYIYPPGILKIGGDVKLKKRKYHPSPFVKL